MDISQSREAIQPDEVKKILVGILEHFDEVCKANNIRYSLGYGTLLGAARHQGFIPWDDDIDVMLPEPDYHRFINLPEMHLLNANYKLHTIDTEKQNNEIYPYTFAKLVDERTEGIYMRTKDTFGAYIDIFPVVGVPEDEEDFQRRFRAFDRNKLRLTIGYRLDRDKDDSLLQKLKTIRRNLYWMHYERYRKKLAEDTFSSNYYESSRVNVSYWNYGAKETFPKTMFERYSEIKFEGKTYPCIADYEAYLEQMYGDWRKLPPENERVPRHEYHLYFK